MMSLTEDQYEVIRPLLPVQRGNVRIANLDVINAVLFVAENGCKWRALPERFGNWHTIYTRLRRWAAAGVLDRVFQALQEHPWVLPPSATADAGSMAKPRSGAGRPH
jgi:transposase